MSSYSKIFSNPYPNGWENLPSLQTPIIAQALQQHTNTIINIENYLFAYDIPQKTSDLINDAIPVPTKMSQLENDLDYLTRASVPSKLSEFQNDVGFITRDGLEIPENLSDYNNDVGFVTDAVNTLINYYLKSEVFSKSEINQLLKEKFASAFSIEVVEELPTSNISNSTIYCIPKEADDTSLITLNPAMNVSPRINFGTVVTSEQEVEDPFNG